jgi:hypothetical protein
MATITTVTNVNPNREDLKDMIWDVSPEEVPFTSGCSRMSANSTTVEWQTDALQQAVGTNAATEGAAAPASVDADTARLFNYTQILTKVAATSGTVEAVDKAGMAKQMAYQVVRRAKEIKRDFEMSCIGINQSPVSGATRRLGSFQAYCKENSSTTGTKNAVGTAYTAGAARAFTEALLATAIDATFVSGGNPDTIMLGTNNKRKLNAFAGSTALTSTGAYAIRDAHEKKIINAVGMYESDFGVMKVIPSRFIKTDTVAVYEKQYWGIAELRGMTTKELGKTGDFDSKQVIYEATLVAKNEKSSAGIYDCSL